MKKSLLLLIFLIGGFVNAQTIVNVTDADISGNTVWTKDNIYVMEGFVFVEDGETLTIEPGTVVKGKPGQAENATALIVARGGKIYAEGTANEPIIFTAEADDVSDPYDFTKEDRGLWGGIILLGNATTNEPLDSTQIEGIPSTESRGAYGGTDDDDNSGVLRYVSIRHGGTDIGAGNEINGLTFGCVGRGTTVEYIEVFANNDDGFEFFGGTAQTKYLVSAFNKDDSFDYDQGFRGKGQFWFSIHDDDLGDRAAEMDGGDTQKDASPYSIPMISNVTFIGSGVGAPNAKNDPAMKFRENAGGKYYNGIITEFVNRAIDIEGNLAVDSKNRLESGDLELKNNIFFGFGAGSSLADIAKNEHGQNYLSDNANGNRFVDPQLRGISRTEDGGLDPRPAVGSPAFEGAMAIDDEFFTSTDFVGAFGHVNWAIGWTNVSDQGFFTENVEQTVVNVTDADISGNTVWTKDNIYVMEGFVFVEDGETLTIEPGTVVKGKPGQAENATALIVARGGKIYAEGTANEPIIFTAEADDVSDPYDFTKEDRGLWGGIILLGNATTNEPLDSTQIEGIPSTESRGAYGGTDDDDNSGVLRYVSIRHGGTDIGAGNEINGLTFGCVGRGTTVEYIEVFANNDDGFEFFGGTAQTKYLVSAFNKDDSFDYDQGYRGKGQFWFSIHDDDLGDRAAEMDGGDTQKDASPYSIPIISNVTFIGSGVGAPNAKNDPAMKFRENAGGKYYNGIITEFVNRAIDIEGNLAVDSKNRLADGDLELKNNIFFGFGAGSSLSDIAKNEHGQNYLSDNANGNRFVDPQLRGISRTEDGGLDPRPAVGSPAFEGAMAIDDEFFTSTDFVGAFGHVNWAMHWTNIFDQNFLGEITDVEEIVETNSVPKEYNLTQNYPNPFNPSTTIEFSVPKTTEVQLTVYNMLGQKATELVNSVKSAGSYRVTWNAEGMASGMYFYRLKAGNKVLTNKMILMK